MDIKADLLQWFTGSLIKNLKGNSGASCPENSNKMLSTLSNQELANDLQKTSIEKFEKKFTFYSG